MSFCQIIVVGDAGVGKTSLIHQLTKKQFNEVVMPTLGVDFSAKNLPSQLDNTTIRLNLWDLAGLNIAQNSIKLVNFLPSGQERFRCLSRAYLKGCQAEVELCDLKLPKIISIRFIFKITYILHITYVSELFRGPLTILLQACIVVFDVTRRKTLKHVADWKKDIDTKCGNIPSLLLANKAGAGQNSQLGYLKYFLG